MVQLIFMFLGVVGFFKLMGIDGRARKLNMDQSDAIRWRFHRRREYLWMMAAGWGIALAQILVGVVIAHTSNWLERHGYIHLTRDSASTVTLVLLVPACVAMLICAGVSYNARSDAEELERGPNVRSLGMQQPEPAVNGEPVKALPLRPIKRSRSATRVAALVTRVKAKRRLITASLVALSAAVMVVVVHKHDTPKQETYEQLVASGRLTLAQMLAHDKEIARRAAQGVEQNAKYQNAAASPNEEQEFLCESASFKKDHYWVNVGANTVRTDQVINGGANGHDAWSMKDISITEDAIQFAQKIDFGGVVLVRQVTINRKDGSFTNNGKTEGKCIVVDKF